MTMMSMVAFAECSDSAMKANAPGGNLAKYPQRQQSDFRKEFLAKRSATMAVVEMCATKNIMMHGKSASTDASGVQSRSVSGIISGKTCLLRKTILKPGTEEKWILCVCTGMPYADDFNQENPVRGRTKLF